MLRHLACPGHSPLPGVTDGLCASTVGLSLLPPSLFSDRPWAHLQGAGSSVQMLILQPYFHPGDGNSVIAGGIGGKAASWGQAGDLKTHGLVLCVFLASRPIHTL